MYRTSILIFAILGLSCGCKGEPNISSTQQHVVSPDESVKFSTEDWELVNDGESIGETATFEVGDLVPCPDEFAEFTLLINANVNGVGYYRFSQTFCRFGTVSFDPYDERGMRSPEFTLTDLVGGDLSGNHFFTKLEPESASVRTKWKITQREDTQEFNAEFDVRAKHNGSLDLGNGKALDWSFNAK